MGIQSRDYFRNDQRGWRTSWSFPPGCKWLIAANIVVFVLQLVSVRNEFIRTPEGIFASRYSAVTEALELDPNLVLHGQVWRLLTYAFCHASQSPWHILFNMLFVAWFGATLERIYGTREFVLFYLAGAFISGVAFLVLELFLGGRHPAIGASGSVMAIVMLYAMHFPRDEVFLFGLFRIQIRFLVGFYLLYDLFPVLESLAQSRNHDDVAHAAHLGGFAFGYLYYRGGFRLGRWMDQFSRPQFRRPIAKGSSTVRLYRPEEKGENLEAQVDEVLQKIQAHGEASLTERERDVLRKASERYKHHPRS